MNYQIKILPAAVRSLRKLDRTQRTRIDRAIQLLATNPRPPASKPLVNRPGWRVRIGDYRVLYTIKDDVLLVVVVAVGHRREIYR